MFWVRVGRCGFLFFRFIDFLFIECGNGLGGFVGFDDRFFVEKEIFGVSFMFG